MPLPIWVKIVAFAPPWFPIRNMRYSDQAECIISLHTCKQLKIRQMAIWVRNAVETMVRCFRECEKNVNFLQGSSQQNRKLELPWWVCQERVVFMSGGSVSVSMRKLHKLQDFAWNLPLFCSICYLPWLMRVLGSWTKRKLLSLPWFLEASVVLTM